MKKILVYSAALFALASCGLKEEFQPVFTGNYKNPAPYAYVDDSDFGKISTIAEVAALYTEQGKPVVLGSTGETVIKGTVITTDQPGNFYKSFYIQDATGGMEIKVGKNGLYNDYLPGQTVYVDCQDLTLGCYGFKSGSGQGMIQLGFSDPSGSYETSYMESPLLVDSHVFRGDPKDLKSVEPYVISAASGLPSTTATQVTDKHIGSLCTLQGLTYSNDVFCLLYLDSQKDKSSFTNRVFLSSSNNSTNPTCGITTWAMSKEKMIEYITSGAWDVCKVGSGSSYATNEDGTTMTIGSLKGENGTYPAVEKAAYSVSHYFKMGSRNVQVRTSGFSKFCDYELPKDILDGSKKMNITGVLTLYQGSIQMVVNSPADFAYEDGTPMYK